MNEKPVKSFMQRRYIPISTIQELKFRIKRFIDEARTTHTYLKLEIRKYGLSKCLCFNIKYDFFDEPYIQKYSEDNFMKSPGVINLTDEYFKMIDELFKKHFGVTGTTNNYRSSFSIFVDEIMNSPLNKE